MAEQPSVTTARSLRMSEWAVFRKPGETSVSTALLCCLHAANWLNPFLKGGAPFKAKNLFFTPCKRQTCVYCSKTGLWASMEELCSTNEPPHNHPRGCHYNLSPPSCFSSPVVFHTFCLYTFSLSLRASAVAVPLAVKLHAQAERRRPTLLPPRLPVQLSPSISLRLSAFAV